ncbi:flagellar hook-length control protein FliK [Deefgea salmonis]|uniref:Flagellar hook-length control protein FliK n=1 Tax=Deefgea salmonis TaxID=2875502 RepID=A0ABS8BKT9_9NEIS|nr:flagellar hook-length control protein FliK [Deefgea salmonis]MCB5196337.1 flagellar hook-length control protein FliK [Deefgea salmonis]
MATTSAVPVQVQAPVSRAVESRTARETSPRNDFKDEFKRELDRDRAESPAPVSAPQKSVVSKPVNKEDAATSESAQSQAATIDPWLAMLQNTLMPSMASASVKEDAMLSQTEPEAQSPVLLDSLNALSLKTPASQTLDQAELSTEDQPQVPVGRSALLQPKVEDTETANLAVDTAKLSATEVKETPLELMPNTDFKTQLTALHEQRSLAANHSVTSALPNKEVAVPVHHLAEPVGQMRWGDALAQRVGLMLGRQEQQIQMQLNPAHLGPMEVQLNVAQDQASVVFSSQNAAVRDALAAAMPRLTALLAEQGFTLSNVQVASDTLQQHQQQQAGHNQSQGMNQGQQQAQNGREPGFTYGMATGLVDEKSQDISTVRLPIQKGGLNLFV